MSNLSDFGKVEFKRSAKASRVVIRIYAEGLRVSLPPHSTKEDAIQYIIKNKQKIQQRQEAVQIKTNELQISFEKEIKTYTFHIQFVSIERDTIFFKLKDGILRIEIPHSADIQSENLQKQFGVVSITF